jgi:eukaryotic-like serine/threonine-protein kinase
MNTIEEAIFHAASELTDPRARAAFLDQACGADGALRARLEALLRAEIKASQFLAQDPLEFGALAENMPVPARTPSPEPPGTVIGRYKLLQKIGEGGMGVVYMAEQEEPVRRRVALKIIKLGMDTQQVVARFEAERQALALMDHPNIAKVLDGGATDTGRPFFVMELVQGVPITEFCDKNLLGAQERIKLFIQVCQAIQSAHQKGIIHRDLKPTNIMVTLNAGVPVPMVIDFGVAKATQQKLTEKTVFTNYATMIGTPAYMSPEQAEMSRLDVDTRSDIYGLGVLLYELLTGTTPFPEKRLRSASYQEMQRIIMEEEPERPSTRLRQKSSQASPFLLATNHSPLSTDLDWIVMKCLEKDRARRYETANGLAADLTRHLENEPVAARPPSNFYRFQKLVRRNKVAFAAGTAVATALLVGLAVSTFLYIQERRAHDSATRSENLAAGRLIESENARSDAEAISKFLTQVFQSPDPARDGRTITVAETLSNATKKLETELTDQPARRAKLQAAIGATYFALGLYREAIPLQEKVRDYYLAASGPEHPDTLLAMHNLAISYNYVGRRDEAIKLGEQVLALRRKTLGPEHPDTLKTMNNLAVSYDEAGRLDETLKLREEVLALSRKINGPEDADTIGAMNNLALSYDNAGRREEALKLKEEVLPLFRKVLGLENTHTLDAMHNLADSYSGIGRRDEALKLREQVLSLRRKVLGPEHARTLWAMNNLADSFSEAGRREEALMLREEVLPLFRKVLGLENPQTLDAMHNLADSYYEAGRNREAIALLEESCRLDPKNTDASLTLAVWQTWSGQDADYEATRCRLLRQAEGTDQATTAERAAKVACLRSSTEAALRTKALSFAQRAFELGKGGPQLPWFYLTLGLAQYRNGQYAAAARNLTIAEQTAADQQDIPGVARLYRAMSLFRQDKLEEARKLLSQAEGQMPPFPKDETKPISDGRLASHDKMICWLAYKEAKALIKAPSAPLSP